MTLKKVAITLIALMSAALAVCHGIMGALVYQSNNFIIFAVVAAITVLAGAITVFDAFRVKTYYMALIQTLQLAGLICFDCYFGFGIKTNACITVDWLSVIIVLIVGLIGGAIAWNSRTSAWMILSMLAADGIALSDNILWMYMFFNIMTLAAYRHIKGGQSKSSDCAKRMLGVNILGGLFFVMGIAVCGVIFEVIDVTSLNMLEKVYTDIVALPAIFIALAGISRSMLMPFQGWFVRENSVDAGAAAMNQSVTLVLSGAVMIIRIAPMMGVTNFAGLMAVILGGVTFFMSSFNAVTEMTPRKMLTDSTSAAMGLIIICAGIGTSESIWAAIMLLMFHAVVKPILIMTSEDKKVRVDKLMATAIMMIAPFALVLFQAGTMGSFADTGNIILLLIICFSSAIALFYWVRWLGTMISDAMTNGFDATDLKHMNPVSARVVLMLLLVLAIPFISTFMVIPYIEGIFGGMSSAASITDSILETLIIGIAIVLITRPLLRGIPAVAADDSASSDDNSSHEGEETHEMLRKSKTLAKLQLICSFISIGIIVLCLVFTVIPIAGLLGGVL